MKKLIFIVGIVMVSMAASLFVAAAPASAQITCDNGTTFNPAYNPTNGQPPCIPITDWSSPGPSAPQGHWATRWGAFASDSEKGSLGTASGMSSKGKATKAAVAHCKSKGGVNCQLQLAYYNQCAVVLNGEYGDGTWLTTFQAAATLEEATDIAETHCQEKGAKNCKVTFSDCSNAEFIN